LGRDVDRSDVIGQGLILISAQWFRVIIRAFISGWNSVWAGLKMMASLCGSAAVTWAGSFSMPEIRTWYCLRARPSTVIEIRSSDSFSSRIWQGAWTNHFLAGNFFRS